jgi:phosphoglycolate phosphatase
LELVADLRAKGFATAICTNKPQRLAEMLVERLGMTKHFDALCGADHFPVRKPHPDHLTGTIRLAGGEPSRAVMIGDSQTDIDTAKAALIPVIAVDFGYSPEPVASFGPDLVASAYDEAMLVAIQRFTRAS